MDGIPVLAGEYDCIDDLLLIKVCWDKGVNPWVAVLLQASAAYLYLDSISIRLEEVIENPVEQRLGVFIGEFSFTDMIFL